MASTKWRRFPVSYKSWTSIVTMVMRLEKLENVEQNDERVYTVASFK